MERKIGLLFDGLRSPYDTAHILQVACALGNCELYLSGNSIDTDNRKILTKVKSWKIENVPKFHRLGSFEEAVSRLHDEGKYLVGTVVNAGRSIYRTDFTKKDSVLVFGTEASGLIKRKQNLLDDIVTVPMASGCEFLTLPTVVPIIVFEYYRQLMELNNEKS